MSPPRRPRTPKLAESLFAGLCEKAGLTANGSDDDQFGWDFLVQFPGLNRGGPADLDPAGATCLVQVKSTRSAATSVRVKLSNALRFAQEPIPCFLVLLTFDLNGGEPVCARVRHIWTEDIGETLKGVRHAHAKNEEALHRLSYTIRFTDAERCELSGVTARIEALVAEIGEDYSARKAAFARTVGYEDGFGEGKFTFDETVDDETFIDMMLGRVKDLPVTAMTMRETRFGLPGPTLIPEGPGRLGIEAIPQHTCQVIVGPADGEGELTLDGDIYLPGVPGLSLDLFRIRVQTRLLELIIRPEGASNVHFAYDADAPLELQTAADLARLLSWINAGPLNFGIWFGGRLLNQGSIPLAATSHNAPWRRLAVVLAKFLEFVPASRWPTEARFNLRDLLSSLTTLETFAGQVSLPGVRLGVGNPAPNFFEAVTKCDRHLSPIYLDFGDATLFTMIDAPIERVDEEPEGFAIVLGQPTPRRRAVLAGSAKANLEFMQRQVALARADLAGEVGVLMGTLGDIESEGPGPP